MVDDEEPVAGRHLAGTKAAAFVAGHGSPAGWPPLVLVLHQCEIWRHTQAQNQAAGMGWVAQIPRSVRIEHDEQRKAHQEPCPARIIRRHCRHGTKTSRRPYISRDVDSPRSDFAPGEAQRPPVRRDRGDTTLRGQGPFHRMRRFRNRVRAKGTRQPYHAGGRRDV
ncbi:unnamed protein product [Ectocarpus fasciculatus]